MKGLHYNLMKSYCCIYIVYVIESAGYGVICTSCLCQKPKRARYGQGNTRIFIEIVL